MVPDGWKRVRFEEVGGGVKNAIVDGPFGSNLKSEHYRNKGIPVFQSGFVTEGKFNPTKYVYVDDDLFRQQYRSAARAGDILMAKIGAQAGRCATIPEGHAEGILAGNSLKITPDTKQFDRDYIQHWLCGKYDQSGLVEIKSTTAQPAISIKNLKSMWFEAPPLSEQRKIAEILSTWDRAIETAEALLATARNQKRALMQTLLTGKRCFPEFEGQEWREVRLGDVLKEVRRPVAWDDNELYRLISVRRRSGGLFHREDLYGRDILTKTLKHAKAGDFLISKMQVVHGAMGLVRDEFDGMQISNSYISVRPRYPKELVIEFFDWLCRLPEMYHRTYLSSYGVHIEKMTFNYDLFLKEKIKLPVTIEEQQAIVRVLDTAECEERSIESQITQLRTEKRALTQQLLTGKRRVQV